MAEESSFHVTRYSSTMRTALAATATVIVGLGAFLLADMRPEELSEKYDRPPSAMGPLEAVNGVSFPHADGAAIITESLAHVRVPFERTLFGKRLRIRARFHLDEADVLEVGVKKSPFWLDYDRRPLQHRVLDQLLTRDERPWQALRSGDRLVFLNPAYANTWTTLDDFLRHPSTDGRLGLYGNAVLPPPQATSSSVAPFRLSDDPDTFRAIYAWYPAPGHADPVWTENEQVFDLTGIHQNDDGSIELMFFVQRKEDGAIRILLDNLTLRFEQGRPSIRDLVTVARRNALRLLKRPPTNY